MTSSRNPLKKYAPRLQKLIATGENLEEKLPAKESRKRLSEYHEWFQQVGNLLTQIELDKILQEIKGLPEEPESVAIIRGKLRGIYLDIEQNAFEPLVHRLQKKGVEDLLAQTDQILKEANQNIESYHLAAISVSIVLEYAVRKLCEHKKIIPEDSKWKPLAELNTKLKEEKIINDHTFNALETWRKIRNDSVHGNFDKIDESSVKRMISGVKQFAEDYL